MHTDITVKEYDIHELADYINWIYFFGFSAKILVDCRHTWL